MRSLPLLVLLAACGPSTLELHAVSAHAASEFLKASGTILETKTREAMLETGREFLHHPERDRLIDERQAEFGVITDAYDSAVAAWLIWHELLIGLARGGDIGIDEIVRAGEQAARVIVGFFHDYEDTTGERLPELAQWIFDILGGIDD